MKSKEKENMQNDFNISTNMVVQSIDRTWKVYQECKFMEVEKIFSHDDIFLLLIIVIWQ